MKLLLSTNNAHKVDEIKAIIGDMFDEIVSLKEAGISLEVEENGDTFEENAALKAVAAAKLSGCAALADDSGLCVDCLGGAPGVHSARYAGDQHNDDDNNKKLIDTLKNYPKPHNARFVSVVVIAYPDGRLITARGEAEGVIVDDSKGQAGFGYDPYFFYPPAGMTFAQMKPEEKNKVSHRWHALKELRRLLEESK
ncbi:MAG: RdgB/HAM1 family non-canonical purine NTP pyrophosphatase [Clostridia bacterium]|nr:RdgB/HAM1 family non-canonical purine NTP pyrophosphatase [Clostridia bacterium]